MQCRRHSKITGKKVTVGLISATPLNATLLFPTEALKPRLDLELEARDSFFDAIPIVLSLVIVILNSSSMGGGGIVKCIDLVMFRAVYMPYLHGQ